MKKMKREAAVQATRPDVSGKTAFFPRNDRPYGLKCEVFQTENALEKRERRAASLSGVFFKRITFEKDKMQGGGIAPPGSK